MVLYGKMGREVIRELDSSSFFKIACGMDCQADSSFSFPIYSSLSQIHESIDVIIDFSVPDATISLLEYAKGNHIPLVIATTGFSEAQLQLIQEASTVIPIFQSANMSYETHVMAMLLRKAASCLPDSDIEIVETHHRNKIDAPSRNCPVSCRLYKRYSPATGRLLF